MVGVNSGMLCGTDSQTTMAGYQVWGKQTSLVDGWIRLCSKHAEQYDEWLLAHQCTIQGRMKDKSGTVLNGEMSRVFTDHMDSGSYASSNQKGSREDDLKPRSATAQAKTREVDEASALNRATELQNREMTRGKTPRRKKQPESDEEMMETRVESLVSIGSGRSSAHGQEGNTGTQLSPPQPMAGTQGQMMIPNNPGEGQLGKSVAQTWLTWLTCSRTNWSKGR